jgi:hypothetical protein
VEQLPVESRIGGREAVENRVGQGGAFDSGVGDDVRGPIAPLDISELPERHSCGHGAETSGSRSGAGREDTEASAGHEEDVRRRVSGADDQFAGLDRDASELRGEPRELVGVEGSDQLVLRE